MIHLKKIKPFWVELLKAKNSFEEGKSFCNKLKDCEMREWCMTEYLLSNNSDYCINKNSNACIIHTLDEEIGVLSNNK
jgi:hypothetical protein